MNLREIVNQTAFIEGLIIEKQGEVTPEIESALSTLEKSLVEKVDNYHHFLSKLDTLVEHYDKKAQEFEKVCKSLKSVKDRLKSSLLDVMLEKEMLELKGDDYKFKIQKSPKKLVITDESKIPDRFKVIKYEIDRAALKMALENEKIEGAHLDEGYHVRGYVNARN